MINLYGHPTHKSKIYFTKCSETTELTVSDCFERICTIRCAIIINITVLPILCISSSVKHMRVSSQLEIPRDGIYLGRFRNSEIEIEKNFRGFWIVWSLEN